MRAQGTLVVELPFDIQAIVEGLKNRSTPRQEAGRHFYAAWGDGGIQRRLHRVSEWTAGLLRACDGRRMIGEVWQQLSAEIQEPDPAVGEYIFVKVLEGAQADELLDIYRTMAAAEASHDGGLSAFA